MTARASFRGAAVRSLMAVVALLAAALSTCGWAGVAAADSEAPTTTTHGLRECDSSVLQTSGYLHLPGVGGTQRHYFYWLFAPRNRRPLTNATAAKPPPVVLWLSGGPGCSSSMALTSELGPCLMNEAAGRLEHNPYGWNDEAYLLFVDQPTGVGYSHGAHDNYAHNETEVAESMYAFLQAFARKYEVPSIVERAPGGGGSGGTPVSDFFITGESYAGHYGFAVAHRVLQGNERGDGPRINLRGVAIGNGITDPWTQAPAYLELAYDYCRHVLGAPCISDADYAAAQEKLPGCLDLIAECNASPLDGVPACAAAKDTCGMLMDMYSATGRNVYDIRKPCVHGEMCYAMEHAAELFRSPVTRQMLGVAAAAEPWVSCRHTVGALFTNDMYRNFNYTVPPLLAANISVLLYAGDMDFICNWIGNKAWATALEWPGAAAFRAAPDLPFQAAGRWAGEERRHGRLSFVRVYEAGHLVPMDQPAAALHVLARFLRDEPMGGADSDGAVDAAAAVAEGMPSNHSMRYASRRG